MNTIFPDPFIKPASLPELRELSRQHRAFIPTTKAAIRLAWHWLTGAVKS